MPCILAKLNDEVQAYFLYMPFDLFGMKAIQLPTSWQLTSAKAARPRTVHRPRCCARPERDEAVAFLQHDHDGPPHMTSADASYQPA